MWGVLFLSRQTVCTTGNPEGNFINQELRVSCGRLKLSEGQCTHRAITFLCEGSSYVHIKETIWHKLQLAQ